MLATKEENFDGAGDGEVDEHEGADGSDGADKFVRDNGDVGSLIDTNTATTEEIVLVVHVFFDSCTL